MMGDVQKFVAAYIVCQTHKYDTQHPAGLLQPFPIPDRIWEDICIDFIMGLPCSNGFDCIFIVVDHLSKFSNFTPLCHSYTAKMVAERFFKEVVRLHGLQRTIVGDRDMLFLSNFLGEMFGL